MKIKFRQGLFSYQRNTFLRTIMRVFVFLCCSVAFAVGTTKGVAQNADIVINTNRTLSVKQVFQLINKQTDYKFIYRHDLIKSAPDIALEKGTIKAYELLDKFLTPINFTYEFTDKGTIIVKRKPVNATPKDAGDSSDQTIQFQISGTVADDQGTPLPGASIVEKGTTNGTQTDFDGNFSLAVDNENAILRVSFIGYANKEIAINGQTNLNIVLEESAAGLDEVVVIGYGTQLRSQVVGAVDQVSDEAFQGRASVNTTQALQGKSPSLTIQQPNSEPGAPLNLNIRGVSTLGNNSPLIVIDGIIGGDINSLNPSDIESVSVLKDAGSAAIYGSRASNGVVLITTKKGDRNSPMTVQYSGLVGYNSPRYFTEPVRGYENAMLRNKDAFNSSESSE